MAKTRAHIHESDENSNISVSMCEDRAGYAELQKKFSSKPNMKIYRIYEFVENTLTMTIEKPNKKKKRYAQQQQRRKHPHADTSLLHTWRRRRRRFRKFQHMEQTTDISLAEPIFELFNTPAVQKRQKSKRSSTLAGE